MKCTRPLRKRIDDPAGFWLYCISELNNEAVHQTAQFQKNPPSLPGDQPLDDRYYVIHGDKGILIRQGASRGYGSMIFTKSGHVFGIALLTSYAPMETFTKEGLIQKALQQNQVVGLVRRNHRPIIGLLIGSMQQIYSACLYLNEKGEMCVFDIETRENRYNKDKNKVCAFIGVKEKDKQAVLDAFRALIIKPIKTVKARKP